MGKKSTKLPVIYLVGVLLVAVGFCCPMFKGNLFGTTSNGFDFLNFKNMGWMTISGLLIFCGAVLGAVFSILKVKNGSLLRLICLIVSIAGGVVLLLKFNDNKIIQFVGNGFLDHAYIGFWMIVAGWVVGLVGAITKK